MAGWGGGGGGGGGGGLGSIGFGELLVHVALFMLSGPALIMLQKYVLDIMMFEYPISIVAVGTVARWILMLVLVHTGVVSLGNYKNMTFVDWTQGMLPVGVLECISLATGTTAYLRLSLSFVQMLKAFEPVVLNLLIVALGLESFSLRMFGCIIVVCIGSILAAIGEVDFDTWGVVLMCISELAEACKYVMLHYFLRNKGYTLWEGLYFSTPASAFSLFALCLVFEREVTKDQNMMIVKHNGLIFFAIVFLAITTAISGFGIIKELGSVSNKVLVMLRNALIIYPATQVYNEIVTPVQLAGYGLTMVGTLTFAVLKVNEEVVVRSKSSNDLAGLVGNDEEEEEEKKGGGGGGGGGGEKESLLKGSMG